MRGPTPNGTVQRNKGLTTSHANALKSCWISTAVLFASLGSAAPTSDHVAQVWALEDDYWTYVQGGDVDRYMSLWHNDIVAWPCSDPLRPGVAAPHPVGKSVIGKWVERIRDEKIRLPYALQHEAAQDFGSVVVVHYSGPMIYEYADWAGYR